MGNSESLSERPIYAIVWRKVFRQSFPLPFAFYTRYVDDCFALIDCSSHSIDSVLTSLNSIDNHIQFTYEIEENNQLPFLDILILRNSNHFSFTVFRKPSSVSLPPHFRSCHPPKQKLAAFYSYVHRALNICSDSSLLTTEINFIKAIALDRGYHPSIIDKILLKLSTHRLPSSSTQPPLSSSNFISLPFYPHITFQLAKILRQFNFNPVFTTVKKIQFSFLKDPISTNNNCGIYQIKCSCHLSYIGQTKRALRFRIAEHINYVKKEETNRSSIAQHVWDTEHIFNFNSAVLLKKGLHPLDLDFYEAYFIHKQAGRLINSPDCTPFLHPVWDTALKLQRHFH